MFTGIIEATGSVKEIISDGSNLSFRIESPISNELKTDQSVNHSGVCLTVEEVGDNTHKVTVVKESLLKTNIGSWKKGQLINLERSVPVTGRLDGHIVQGHTDTTLKCIQIKGKNGSREYDFAYPKKFAGLVIEKGSIAINGISLTVFNVKKKGFRIAIIPFTFDHTAIKYLKEGDFVNIEFDVLGKYIQRYMTLLK